ncbi:DUF5793 family protein [Natronobacterium gregoryi]|uniref:Uncharacterized protein n=2 Tax=Natronobacterium gregoryi TaxID=44930 RepID=L0ADP3_NATGS|nr:DUF5793 family protein [Natronobacterium gregoryi]AFZ71971.1 hypothetical protein Natgr_0729 [Natronobacterium gregoryi SP2]ELY62665.1 hypothetical protein C490_17619 [Natronobacterium gregoryi SP2]PLK20827.1 hypothetical protein CYV19_07035 [Natronobacterium gregoryi SP2]SFJ19260.1 hypothetical protein SAMN05443661_1179 [Natronobacterium gregoryi]
MRREHFTLDVSNVDWVDEDGEPEKPVVSIDFTGPVAALRERLTGPDDDVLEAGETDVALRLQEPLGTDAAGVVSVTNRVTGEFILELNEDASDVVRFIRAARGYGEAATDDEGRYEVEISLESEPFVAYDKQTFLVYDDKGSLLRQHSLIPSGVEL